MDGRPGPPPIDATLLFPGDGMGATMLISSAAAAAAAHATCCPTRFVPP